jgi:hypothetical protein
LQVLSFWQRLLLLARLSNQQTVQLNLVKENVNAAKMLVLLLRRHKLKELNVTSHIKDASPVVNKYKQLEIFFVESFVS